MKLSVSRLASMLGLAAMTRAALPSLTLPTHRIQHGDAPSGQFFRGRGRTRGNTHSPQYRHGARECARRVRQMAAL